MTNFKNFCSSVLLIVIAFSVQAFSQNDFEGKVVLKISEDETAADVDYFVKDEKTRMEMKSNHGSMVLLYDQKSNKTLMMMPEQKMYMEFNAMDFMQHDESSDNSDTDINRTGEYKDINGYNSEKWIIKEDDETIEAWMTDELGGFFMMNNPMGQNQNTWQKELAGKFFPMRVDIIEGSEKKKVLEVLSVNKMSLNNDLFDVPQGFKKLDMPNMMK